MKKLFVILMSMLMLPFAFAAQLIFYDDFENGNISTEGWYEASLPSYHITEDGGVIVGDSGNGGWLLQNFTNISLTDAITLTAIEKNNVSDGSGSFQLGFSTNDFSQGAFILFTTDGDITWQSNYDSVTCNANDSSVFTIEADDFGFHNYSVIFDNNIADVYYDGILEGSVAFTCNVTDDVTDASITSRTPNNIISDFYLYGTLPCTPNWSCTGYGLCNVSNLQPCNAATDLNVCGEVYGGDYSEFTPQACSYGYSIDYEADDLAPIAVDAIGQFFVVLISFVGVIAIGVIGTYVVKWLKR